MYADELGEYIRKSSVSAVADRAKHDGRQVRSSDRTLISLDGSSREAAEPLMSPGVLRVHSDAHWWLLCPGRPSSTQQPYISAGELESPE